GPGRPGPGCGPGAAGGRGGHRPAGRCRPPAGRAGGAAPGGRRPDRHHRAGAHSRRGLLCAHRPWGQRDSGGRARRPTGRPATRRRGTAQWRGKRMNSTALSQTLSQTLTMAYRCLLKVRRTPEQLFDVVFQPVVFTLMFTYIFGGAIAGSVHDYLPIIVPGILIQTLVGASVAAGVQLRDDMDKGVFDRFRTMPIARIAPLAGVLLADTVRYAIAAGLTFAMGFLLGYRPRGNAAQDQGLRTGGRRLPGQAVRPAGTGGAGQGPAPPVPNRHLAGGGGGFPVPGPQ